MECERKLIKLKDQEKLMSLEDVYVQFKNFLFKSVRTWLGKYEFDDLVSVAFIGLSKAYKNYSADKDVLFMTYLAPIVNNELLMYNRKEERNLYTESLDKSITGLKDGNDKLTFIDMIADEVNYEEKSINGITYSEIMEIINSLDERDKYIITEFYINNKKQDELGKELNLSQSYISRLLRKIPEIIKNKYERGKIMYTVEPKITKEQLAEEIKMHGTGKEAITLISEKYGLREGTISAYITRFGLKSKADKQENISKKEVGSKEKITGKDVSSPVISEDEYQFKGNIPSNKILQPLVLRGKVMEYRVKENSFAIKNLTGTTTLLLNANEIDDFIKELKALKDVV